MNTNTTLFWHVGLPLRGAPGDTKTNGNSILAFWFMRILLAGCFVGALFALQYQWQLWRSTPILFILSNKGVTDRDGIYRSWAAFEDAFISKGTLYLKLSSESGSKTIIVEPNEIGFSATDKMITHIRKNAPPELSTKL